MHFEVCDVESCVVVRVKLIGKIKNNLVSFTLLAGVNELVDEALADVFHFAVAGDQTVKFELDLIGRIQIRYAFLFVRYQHALNQWQTHIVSKKK